MKPTEYEDQLPNPFGGEPFPSRATFSLKEAERKAGRAIIEWTQKLDPEKSTPIIEKTLQDMAARLGRRLPDGELRESISMEDKAEFVVDLSSGWLDRMTHTRTVKSGEVVQEDNLTIERKREQAATRK